MPSLRDSLQWRKARLAAIARYSVDQRRQAPLLDLRRRSETSRTRRR